MRTAPAVGPSAAGDRTGRGPRVVARSVCAGRRLPFGVAGVRSERITCGRPAGCAAGRAVGECAVTVAGAAAVVVTGCGAGSSTVAVAVAAVVAACAALRNCHLPPAESSGVSTETTGAGIRPVSARRRSSSRTSKT